MSKAVSYYDWTLNFKKNAPNHNYVAKSPELNSIGLKKSEFEDFIAHWKKKNLE